MVCCMVCCVVGYVVWYGVWYVTKYLYHILIWQMMKGTGWRRDAEGGGGGWCVGQRKNGIWWS
jgi:hypothetical protein